MARRKKGGHRRNKKFPIVRTVAKAAVAVDGGRRIWDARQKIWFWTTHPGQLIKDPGAAGRDLQDAAVGVLEITVAPKLINTAYSAVVPAEVKKIAVAGHRVV